MLSINAAISSATSGSISTNGGLVNLNGNGLPASWPHSQFRLKIVANGAFVQPVIVGTSPTKMTILLPPASDGVSYSISLAPPVGGSSSKSVVARTSHTPVLSLSSASLTTPGANSLTFTKTNLQSADPDYVEVYSLYNSNEIYNKTLTGSGASQITVSVDLPGGIFGFRFFYVSYGFATCADNVSITISQPSFPSLLASYNGGSFSISGSGLSPSATLDFAGFKT